MDGSCFDTLAGAVAPAGTRRRLVTLLAALPLGGVLAIADEAEEVGAERPLGRVQRNTQQRNTHKNNNNKNNRKQTNNLGACEKLYQPCIDSRAALHADDGSTCCFILADCDVARYNQCLVAIGFACPPD
jgi:hypothetical protein